jgi:hypothetical protein
VYSVFRRIKIEIFSREVASLRVMSSEQWNTRADTMKLLNSVYMVLMEKLLERIIKVTEVDEDIAIALRQHMLKPMLFHVVEDEAPVWRD